MNRQEIPLLSKSGFAAGLQCHKRLFLAYYSRELADPIDPSQQALFDVGTAVGELARQRYPGGRLVDEPYYEHDRAVAVTREALDDRSVPAIFEAAFTHDDIRIRADVLRRYSANEFDLVEVKSSTSVKEEHIPDVAIQLYALEGSGITIRRTFLLHIDNTYIYDGGSYDLSGLFQLEDVTDEARMFVKSFLPTLLADMREVMRLETAPPIEIGRQCTRPYRCSFYGHCWRGAPDHHIFQLPRVRTDMLDELQSAGIRDIRDIPSDFPGLTPTQRRVRDCVASGRPYVDPALSAALNQVAYPLNFLDFETVNPALPLHPGTRPYEMIPFQWSLHTRDREGHMRHHSFLHDGSGDPREALTTSLLDAIGSQGTIVVYTSFEKTRVGQLADALPQFAGPLHQLPGRMLDLWDILKRHVYHPDFHGSYSIKAVLPALVPEVSYSDLDIQEGTHASVAFVQMIAPQTEESEKRRIREALLAYCQRDTEAMVRIFDALASY